MVIEKFNIVTYIKPNHDFEMFATSLANIQQTKYLNKFCICFVKKLSNKFINELNKYENIIWKDNVNNYWAIEMKKMIDENNSKYYFIWEEDSHIYDITQFEKTYESLISNDIDFMLTQDKKWISRAEHLLQNNLAIQENEFLYFNWGTNYAKFCRETSDNVLVNGAYPVTVNGIFSKSLLTSLLDMLLESKYWKNITAGNFNHFHQNPKLPHSFEVFPGFWWKGKNNGYGNNLEYKTMISTIQFAKELGGRLINK
tara:strand:- start:610 stop:1377 length:768 start_codon:yes stop_codon:yes gene_type:complete